ncbi:MAG: hypothetical protein IJ689_04210 [Alphaproteobacteria bacterium]|nr:hypothetical protein [Alphaproteobacteria bacterium]
MKNYILLTAVAAVSIGSYAAYASNSATMTVTATIAHDVSLSVTQDIDLGTITINPGYTEEDTQWTYSDSGVISFNNQGAIVWADNATLGTFTANVPNPEECTYMGPFESCSGLQLDKGYIDNLFGGSESDLNGCYFTFEYTGRSNTFKVYPHCYMETPTKVTHGSHSGTLTISYTAS